MRLSRLTIVAVAMFAAACGPTDTTPTGRGSGSLEVAVDDPRLAVILGSRDSLRVTVERSGGFVGPVGIAIEGGSTTATTLVSGIRDSGTQTIAWIVVDVPEWAVPGDFPFTIRVSGAGGLTATTAARLLVRSNADPLPVLNVTTAGGAPIESREIYLPGTFTLTDAAGQVAAQGNLDIRGRGSSTWGMPKKPYRLRLATSTPLLSMPANRHWVLLANFADKTLLRNELAFELSRILGMEYTPRSRPVSLILNGSYDGVYYLTEHIRIGSNRIDIPELRVTDTSATAITGGYLIEIDARRGEDFCFDSSMTLSVFCLSNPETLLEPAWARQREYIESYVRRIDTVLLGPQFADPVSGYAALIDVESALSYYFVNELFRNVDGNLRLSTFLYKKRGGKLFFGPVWDFDLAIGNANYGDADRVEGWHIRTAPWFERMFQDPVFAARARTRWRQMATDRVLERLMTTIDARADSLGYAQVRNFQRWPILDTWVWPNRVVTGSYRGEILAMKQWLADRWRWMDGQFTQ